MPFDNACKYLSETYPTEFASWINAGLVIQSLIQEVEEYWNQENINEISTEPIKLIEIICNKFHLVARQLRERYKNRNTLEIEDKYDVQDLFHALLNIYFDDIKAEEYYFVMGFHTDFLIFCFGNDAHFGIDRVY